MTGGTRLAPIDDISAAAARIAGGQLGELGRLAAVLNDTFAQLEAAFA